MRIVSAEHLGQVLSALPGAPRVVAGGNYATPWQALAVPDRDGVTLETPFVGPGRAAANGSGTSRADCPWSPSC
jgi:hypothetical protein